MTLTIVRGDEAAPIAPLRGRTVAVIGYGNQGRAHALNLRDSGVSVVVGARREGSAAGVAARDGFEPVEIPDAARRGDLVVMALPDEVQPEVYRTSIAPALRGGAVLGFLHGFNVRFGFIEPGPEAGVVMVAPKGPGRTLRHLYVEGRGLPCLLAVHREPPGGGAEALALAWANGIGCARAGIIRTTFGDEAETDLFGEQAVLCGGMTALIRAAYETLCEAGYAPELAYLECCHEVKQIADLIYERGPAGMGEAISTTAEFGAYRADPVIVDEAVRQRMAGLLADVRSGAFARALREDYAAGSPWFGRRRAAARAHPMEAAGVTVRSLMPWLAQEP